MSDKDQPNTKGGYGPAASAAASKPSKADSRGSLDAESPESPAADPSTPPDADVTTSSESDPSTSSESDPSTSSESDSPDLPDTNSNAPERPGRSPSLAAFLSFVWPGLGQLYLRNRRLAAVFAVPSLVVVALLAYALRRGPVVLAAQLFAERGVGLLTVAIIILFGAWRIASVVLAFLGGNRNSHRVVNRAVLGALAAIIVVIHLGGGYYLLAYSDAGTQVFNPTDTHLIVQATQAPSLAPGQTPGPAGTPEPLATVAGDGRVTILFTGTSSGASSNLYDSIMVVSYDPQANSIQMVSVPRDSASFPFYFGGVDDHVCTRSTRCRRTSAADASSLRTIHTRR